MTVPRTKTQANIAVLVSNLKQQRNEADFTAKLAEFSGCLDESSAMAISHFFNLTTERALELYRKTQTVVPIT